MKKTGGEEKVERDGRVAKNPARASARRSPRTASRQVVHEGRLTGRSRVVRDEQGPLRDAADEGRER